MAIVILVSEIGDKTFFIAAIMAMRNDRLVVFTGAIAALVRDMIALFFGAPILSMPPALPRAVLSC